MKKRDQIFMVTATLIFTFSWAFLSSIVSAAQAVGDAPSDFEPASRTVWLCIGVTSVYALLYYIFSALMKGNTDRKYE